MSVILQVVTVSFINCYNPEQDEQLCKAMIWRVKNESMRMFDFISPTHTKKHQAYDFSKSSIVVTLYHLGQ